MATKTALACSHNRSLQLLCTVGGNQARLDARTEFKILEPSPKGGVEAHHCTACCTTSFPPLWRDSNSLCASNFAWLPPAVHSNCSEAVCLAARTLFLEAFLCSAVIFVKCRKVSTRTTLPNFIDLFAERALYSRFGGHNGRRS